MRVRRSGPAAFVAWRGLVVAIGAFAAVLLVGATAAHAASTFTVTTATDADDGACTPSLCTLRDAITYSQAGDTVVVPAETYTLTAGQLSVGHDLTIDGAGVGRVTVSGDNASRVFEIEQGATATVSGMTVTGGNGNGGQPPTGVGGGIRVFGTLTLADSAVSGNTAAASGGGIDANGTLIVERSTISDNSSPGPGFAIGGGIDCFCTSVTVSDSTIAGNSAGGPNGTGNQGGGILFDSGGALTITNSTIAGNAASASGGGIYDDSEIDLTNATLASNSAPDGANLFVNDESSGGFENTIIASPAGGGGNCDTSGNFPPSNGHNLEDDAGQSCFFADPSDQSGVDAKLGALGDNGGPTQTIAPLAGSPAIDAGEDPACPVVDQRGVSRPQGPHCDIGAVEVGASMSAAGGRTFSGRAPLTVSGALATITDSDTSTSAADHTATVDWGDGTSDQNATISGANGSFSIADSHTYATPGSYTITVRFGNANNTAESAVATDTAQATSTPTTAVTSAPTTVITARPTVTGPTAAAFSGSVVPGGSFTTARFQYGLDPKYSGGGPVVYTRSTPSQPVGSDFSSHAVAASVSGLVPNALYHVRLVASNSAGTTFGPDVTFATKPAPAPPSPSLGRTFNIKPVSGVVLVAINGQFVPLTQLRRIPQNAVINALHGALQLITASGSGPAARDAAAKRGKQHEGTVKTQTGRFGGAIFKIQQTKRGANKGLVTLSLVEGAFKGAPGYGTCKAHNADEATAARTSKTLQLLRASAKGRFRTRGRYAAATVRGTKWTIADLCDATLTRDITHSVAVTDFVRHKTIVLHAGQHYLARAPK